MILKTTDIDQILEETADLADDEINFFIKYFEIDLLLEQTENYEGQ